MTDTNIIIAVAKLDGWKWMFDKVNSSYFWCSSNRKQNLFEELEPEMRDDGTFFIKGLLPYLTSRDAIIPVIEKQHVLVRIEIEQLLVTTIASGQVFNDMTAKWLCIALLKATGKWEE